MIKTNIELLNEISAKLGGKSDASVLVEGLNNIANALGDTDPDQMVTVPQALETVLEYVGGGGGGISNPILTINCINSINPTVFLLYKIEDGILKYVEDVVDPGETKAVETIAVYNEDWSGGEYLYYFGDAGEGTVSDLSNCTVSKDRTATITDPTKPASLTFTIVVG